MASAQKDISGQESTPMDTEGSSGMAEGAAEHQGGGRACVAAQTLGVYFVEETTFTSMSEQMLILFGRLPEDSKTPETLLVALLYLLALECGFTHSSDHKQGHDEAFTGFFSYPRAKSSAATVPIEWLRPSGNFQERHFRLLHFSQDFSLVTHNIAGSLCITFTPKNFSGFSICLSVSRYIPIIHRESVLRSFRHLPELSVYTKNKLFLPARDIFMQNMMLLTPYPSLISTPDIVLVKIFRLLPQRSRKNLADSCDRMGNIFNSDLADEESMNATSSIDSDGKCDESLEIDEGKLRFI
uniref:Uncharacterized protein n=1 Tax=Lutzomyia longipalpis TaxID=7200 RepID=A0A1B0ET55_LUTLO